MVIAYYPRNTCVEQKYKYRYVCFLLGRIMNCGPAGNNKVLFFERKTNRLFCLLWDSDIDSTMTDPPPHMLN